VIVLSRETWEWTGGAAFRGLLPDAAIHPTKKLLFSKPFGSLQTEMTVGTTTSQNLTGKNLAAK
jgi:hypothetical protein